MKSYRFADPSTLPENVRLLLQQSGQQSFFVLPDWYRLVGECGLDAGFHASLVVTDDARLAMACRQGPREAALHSCTNLYSCEFDLLGDHADTQAVYAFSRELVSSAGPLDSIRLEGLDPASARYSALLDGMRAAGLVAKPYFAWANWFEGTQGMAFSQFVSTRPSLLRNTWKRKRTTVARSAGAEFRICGKGADPEPLIADYEKVHGQSWKAAEPYPLFIPNLIRLAARLGALRFGVLSIDGVPVASQFWIVWAGRATIYKLVHVQNSDALSPGTLLTMEMMRTVLETDRPSEIDFGRGDDAYKKLWLTSRRERWGIEAANPRKWRGIATSVRIRAALARDRMKTRRAER
ncbi:MAG TPA: GNAT family N-acetyltransferase [Rhizomicrobium sp.]|jgi:hypothetical protein|nr:GNAT family N-acetyltransferase [Rhizomicrobium sp.]